MEFVTGEIIRGEGPTAVASKLRWLLSGALDNVEKNNDLLISNLIIFGNCNSFKESSHSDPLVDVLKNLLDLETVGVVTRRHHQIKGKMIFMLRRIFI